MLSKSSHSPPWAGLRIAILFASIPFVLAASPLPSPYRSPVPADAIALPAANGSWLAIVTITGGRIARFHQFVVASDGRAASTGTGSIVLGATALATVAAAVSAARDASWRIPHEDTCCDRVIANVKLERRFKRARQIAHTTQSVEAGTLLPADAGTVVRAVESAFETQPSPSPT